MLAPLTGSVLGFPRQESSPTARAGRRRRDGTKEGCSKRAMAPEWAFTGRHREVCSFIPSALHS